MYENCGVYYCVLVSGHCVIVMLWLLRRCVSKFILVLLVY